MYPYGLVGNCQLSALIHESGSIDWCCFPRPDSAPFFGRLLDAEGGHFSVETTSPSQRKIRYVANTNILVTSVDTMGGTFEISDFCPRLDKSGSIYRPNALFRIIRPLQGEPEIRVVSRPVQGWNKEPAKTQIGSSHLIYGVEGGEVRLFSNLRPSDILEERPFKLTQPIYLSLGWDFELEGNIEEVSESYYAATVRYWRTWVKHCFIPSEFQKESIRSALALKLHCYEETGAILASLTTSLPEATGEIRNWDYRFCWLRDSYFALSAFHQLGHFEEMEGFLRFLSGVTAENSLAPVYRIDRTLPIPEVTHPEWAGYKGSGPVRSGNAAAHHVQNDVFGELLLAFAPIYFDERFNHLRTPEHDALMTKLAHHCAESVGRPDAGLWELRAGWREHTFTNLMCWAGLDRYCALRQRGFFAEETFSLEAKEKAQVAVLKALVDGSLRNGPSDPSYDAALLLLSAVRFPGREFIDRTVASIHDALKYSDGPWQNFLYRYHREDDFGVPGSAFLFCSFWWLGALVKQGRRDEARQGLIEVLKASNSVGLFSEHYDPRTEAQLGNFPQAYSHVGLLLTAFAVSPPWDEVL